MVPVDLYIAAYDDADAAQEDFDALKELVKDGVIFMDVAVLVSRDAEGKLTVKENAHEVAKGGMVGRARRARARADLPGGCHRGHGRRRPRRVRGSAVSCPTTASTRSRRRSRTSCLRTPPASSRSFDEVWVEQVEKALAKAEKIDKDKIDKESVEKAKEAASKAS
jgi:hypothetical protein